MKTNNQWVSTLFDVLRDQNRGRNAVVVDDFVVGFVS